MWPLWVKKSPCRDARLTANRGRGAGGQLRTRNRQIAAVRGVSFAVEEGETFGLVGPSGCGKSTVLRVIAGLQREWSGRVSALSQPYRPGRRLTGEVRRAVQMVFQDPYASLHPRHTIRRTLEEPLRVNRVPAARTRAAEALAAVGLAPELARRYPNALSGGQRQRVAIARALLLRPRLLLLLDEPTSALDMSVQAEILNLLNDLKRASGMTFILVSHDMDVIAHMCDRAATMRRGQIIEVMGRGEAERDGRRGIERSVSLPLAGRPGRGVSANVSAAIGRTHSNDDREGRDWGRLTGWAVTRLPGPPPQGSRKGEGERSTSAMLFIPPSRTPAPP